MTKTYDNMREEMELHEISLGRAGSTLFFAAQVRNNGKQLEQVLGKAKGKFGSSKTYVKVEDKLDRMADGMTEMANALILQRKMIGSLTGLGLSAALTQEKSDKETKKLMKGRRR